MDSGNSSSMQSSSGGDEQEYDSGSLIFDPNMSMSMDMNLMMMMKPPPAQVLNHSSWAPSPLVRSDPNTSFLSFTAAASTPVEGPSHLLPPPIKNPKKRTRASRRAPTTVLSTDTNNFRAMVQEFTGIPDPPFSGSRRLDLLSTARRLGPPQRQRLLLNQDRAFQPLIHHQQPQQQLQPAFGMNMGMPASLSPPQPGNQAAFGSSSANPNNINHDYVTSHTSQGPQC